MKEYPGALRLPKCEKALIEISEADYSSNDALM